MNTDDFLKKITEIMDTESALTLDTKLSDVEEWDSLSIVSFLSFCNVKLKLAVEADEIKSAVTVKDLFKLIGKGSC